MVKTKRSREFYNRRTLRCGVIHTWVTPCTHGSTLARNFAPQNNSSVWALGELLRTGDNEAWLALHGTGSHIWNIIAL